MTETAATLARQGNPQDLAHALHSARSDTLSLFAALQSTLGHTLQVPQQATLNPPLWELGHIGWFQEYWLARNPQWRLGDRADPDVARGVPLRDDADRLYNSSQVPHDSRWQLPLPDADATRSDLARHLESSLQRLQTVDAGDDEAMYFFRLALLHEDMHHEAGLYMARALDLDDADLRWQQQPEPGARDELEFDSASHCLGQTGPGFAFDNECAAHEVAVPAFRIDRRVVTWRDYLPFVESGTSSVPRYLRRDGSTWLQRRHRRWQPLDLDHAACHLSGFEARAWCDWAGRRLPTEAEWERAAESEPQRFAWGQVWEWTASPFAPYPGFRPHPYRDYSAPWFDGRPVLRGASHLTQPRMRHLRYRNYFTPDRSDVVAGFRSCALQGG